MRIEIVYVFPANAGELFAAYAWRFLQSYLAFPPGMEHGTTIVCNGASPSNDLYAIFKMMPNVRFFEHDNSGYDIGAFQHVAREVPCDMMVFFGSSAYLQGGGWLVRMAVSYQRHGRALYGVMGNRGVGSTHPHIRTTGFWMPPSLLNEYPIKITRPEQRYQFEHGENCLTTWVTAKGLQCWVVGWSGEYLWADWDNIPNGFHRGNQSDLLSGDRLTEAPFYP